MVLLAFVAFLFYDSLLGMIPLLPVGIYMERCITEGIRKKRRESSAWSSRSFWRISQAISMREYLLRIASSGDMKHYPLFLKAVAERHMMYNEELAFVRKREAEGRALVFRPSSSLPIKHTSHDPNVMRRVYELGREQAMLRLQEIKAFLSVSVD
jgi:hypothetical protein